MQQSDTIRKGTLCDGLNQASEWMCSMVKKGRKGLHSLSLHSVRRASTLFHRDNQIVFPTGSLSGPRSEASAVNNALLSCAGLIGGQASVDFRDQI